MKPEKRFRQLFADSIAVHQAAADTLPAAIARAADMLCKTLESGAKVMSCGNGGSAADAQHFAAELINRFENERRGLAAVALTTDTSVLTSIANDYEYDRVFARQVEALGRPGDALVAISTSGNSRNVNAAVQSAQEIGMRVIGLSGRDGGELADLVGASDVEIRVPAESTARIQEVHVLVLHCLCDHLDQHFSR